MTRPDARSTQLIDDPRTRVTRFDFAPDARTGRRVHRMAYVIVAPTECQMVLDEPKGFTAGYRAATPRAGTRSCTGLVLAKGRASGGKLAASVPVALRPGERSSLDFVSDRCESRTRCHCTSTTARPRSARPATSGNRTS